MRLISHIYLCLPLLLDRSQNRLSHLSKFPLMNWQYLYKKQLDENQELKKQLDIAESILRNFLPIIDKKDDQN